MPAVLCPSCRALLSSSEAAEELCPSCGKSLESLRPPQLPQEDHRLEHGEARPAFVVHKAELGFLPIGRFCYCALCEEDLTNWVEKQAPDKTASCPRCGAQIEAAQIAEEQRQTRIGCLLSFAGALVFLLPIVFAVAMWLRYG